MRKIHDILKKFDSRFVLIIAVVFIAFMSLGYCISHYGLNAFHEAKNALTKVSINQQSTLNELNQVQTNLSQLSSFIEKSSLKKEDLDILNKQLSAIESSVLHLNQQTNDENLKSIIANENAKLAKQLLKNHIKAQNQSSAHNKLYTLHFPFKVTSVDIWNGQPMATINLGNETELMAEGDSRSGWILFSINFDESTVIFKNKFNQFVKLSI